MIPMLLNDGVRDRIMFMAKIIVGSQNNSQLLNTVLNVPCMCLELLGFLA